MLKYKIPQIVTLIRIKGLDMILNSIKIVTFFVL